MLLLPGAITTTTTTRALSEHDYSQAARIREKIAGSRRGELNYLYVYVLQAPLMLLGFSVLTFVAGLCCVVFSPLGRGVIWGDDAKVSVFVLLFEPWLGVEMQKIDDRAL